MILLLRAMNTVNDTEYLMRIRANNSESEAAFKHLYRQYSPSIYSYCRKMLPGNGHFFPEDVVQQAFMSFHKAVHDGALIENVGAFIMTIARNICYNELKRTRIADERVDDVDIVAFPTHDYEQAELLELLYQAVERLSPEDKELFILREQLGHSYDEISVITGLSVVVARQRTHRIRITLRKMLSPYIADIESNSGSENE